MAGLVTLQGFSCFGNLGADLTSVDDSFRALLAKDGDAVFKALAAAMDPIIDSVRIPFEAAKNDADEAILSMQLYRLRRIQGALYDANLEDLLSFATADEKVTLLTAYTNNAPAALAPAATSAPENSTIYDISTGKISDAPADKKTSAIPALLALAAGIYLATR